MESVAPGAALTHRGNHAHAGKISRGFAQFTRLILPRGGGWITTDDSAQLREMEVERIKRTLLLIDDVSSPFFPDPRFSARHSRLGYSAYPGFRARR
jgi:hypothetical protein